MVGMNRQELSRSASQRRPSASAAPATDSTPRPLGKTGQLMVAIVSLCLVAGLTLAIDMPVAKFWRARQTPAFVVDVLECAETFGNGAGVLLLMISGCVLGAIPTRALPRVAMASLGSGLVADLFKLIVARTRPRDLTIQQSVLETFAGWFPPAAVPSALHSFPSAHVATAAGLAIALSYYYPRGKYLFTALVALALVQRLQTGAHFVSDTMAGAAIGLCLPLLLFRVGPIARWFDRFEQHSAATTPSNSRVPTHHLPLEG